MRIAAFNVVNLFDRARVFNDPDPGVHQPVLDAHAELNTLFERPAHEDTAKARMLVLIDFLGMSGKDEGRFTRIRKVHAASDHHLIWADVDL